MVKDSDILKEARRRIAEYEASRVCYAIGGVGTLTQRNRLYAWIRKMLDGRIYYEDWLRAHHREFADQVGIESASDIELARPGRLAWLDWMIAECEKEEAAHG